MSPKEVANSFFAAIERDDMEAVKTIYHDDIKVWHNFSNASQNKTENVGVLSKLRLFEKVRYEPQEVIDAGDRLVQRHWLVLTEKGGKVHRLAGVIFMTIRDDQILDIEEYFDSVPVQEIFAYMAANEVA